MANDQATPSNIGDNIDGIAADSSEAHAERWNQQQEKHKDEIQKAADKVAADIKQAGINACAAIDQAGKAQAALLKEKIDKIMSDNAGDDAAAETNQPGDQSQGDQPAL